jgi:uncharacterized membrane protein YbhN (UPF0104 family)
MAGFRPLISIGFLIAVFVLVGTNYSYSAALGDVARLSKPALVIIALSVAANALAASLRLKRIAAMMGHPLSFRQAMAAAGMGSLVGAIFFQIAGQLMGRSFVMKRAGVPFESVVVLTLYERVVAAVFSAILALAGAYYVFGTVYLDQDAGGGALIKITLGLLAATAGGALLGYGRLAARATATWLNKDFVRRFSEIILLTVLVQSPMMVAYVAASHALSPHVPILELAATSAIVMFAASIPVSLAGWGVREMSAVIALGTIGVARGDAFLAAMIVGACSLVGMAALACVSLFDMGKVAEPAGKPVAASIDYSRALIWVMPIAVATLVFFQVYVPIQSGTLLNVNLADPLAILAGVIFVAIHVRARAMPVWRYPFANAAIIAATLFLSISLLLGADRYGWTDWAVVNRYGGWFILLSYAASGALITKECGEKGFRILLLTFAGAAVAVALLDLVLVAFVEVGVHLTLPLVASEIQGFSLNHNFFAFQLLMALPAVFLSVRGPRPQKILAGILLAALVWSGSRSGWIATMVVLFGCGLVRAATWKTVSATVVYAAGVVALLLGIPLVVGNLLGAGVHVPEVWVSADNTHDRLVSIMGGLQLFSDNPIFGAGLGAFRDKHIVLNSTQPLLIHSTYVWLLAELGFAGFLAFAIPPALALIEEARRRCDDAGGRLFVLCFVGFAVMSLPADMVYQRTFWLLLGAALAKPCAATIKNSTDVLAAMAANARARYRRRPSLPVPA